VFQNPISSLNFLGTVVTLIGASYYRYEKQLSWKRERIPGEKVEGLRERERERKREERKKNLILKFLFSLSYLAYNPSASSKVSV